MAGVEGRSISWWQWLPLPWRRWRVVQAVDAGDEIPERLPRRSAVIVGSLEAPRWVAFDCPCAERHRVMLNLDRQRRPTWRLLSGRPLTLSPSVDEMRSGKRCHYFVRKGRIQWVPYNEAQRTA